MSEGMDCRRAEELLSDHLEGALEEPLLSELDRHFGTCAGCRELRGRLAGVVAGLRELPVPDPPPGLAQRAAAAAAARTPPAWRLTSPLQGMPPGLQAAAAALTLVVSGGVLALTGSVAAPRAAERLQERAVNAAVHLVEKKDRLIEDFRILRVVVGTAFGGRVESLNDRVEDYRRLLEERRETEPSKKSGRVPIEHPGPWTRNS